MVVHGKTVGLKHQVRTRLEHLYRRRVPANRVTTPELARQMTELSLETGRQVGVLVNRRGQIEYVIVGDASKIELPDFGRQRGAQSRFRGLRLVHTHLKGEALTRDDLNDLALLRLDLVAAVNVQPDGLPGNVHVGHLLPDHPEEPLEEQRLWETLPPVRVHDLDLDFQALIASLEAEVARSARVRSAGGENGAVLVGVTRGSRSSALESLAELRELARTAGVTVLDSVLQVRKELDPRTLLGKGKLQELMLRCMQLGAELIVFDRDLTPGQMNAIAEATDLRVLDRTQLILDIFAQRATSRDGKLQVELAQLKYRLPRLRGKGDAMSRLMGGIGGRGPGETKLESDRRRTRERIHRLERELHGLSTSRAVRRRQRNRRELPVISIVGYTNAGKSTLLAALTGTQAYSDDLLFATLDPASRRLRFPREREVILTDTVGFIRDLPADLLAAFRATLEELRDADLLLHVVDAADPQFESRIEAVESILAKLDLGGVPRLLVFNKIDRLNGDAAALGGLCRSRDAVAVSALTGEGFAGLVERADRMLSANGVPPVPAEGPSEGAGS
ncbi:MAG: GTPase [Candidatus Binatota bacterium]|nr:GTPase [Candidatus Binatota bacterium]